MNLNSKDFIKKLMTNDPDATELLVISYNENLLKGALKMGLAIDQAEEVVQATWSAFFENVCNFKQKSHIRTYLFGIMYNKIKEIWRSNKKYTEDFSDEVIESLFNNNGSFARPPLDPSDWVHSGQVIDILKECIDKLPEAQRMAFYLKEVQGEKTQEICKILHVSTTNLGVLIYRAKNNIRLQLEKKFSKEDEL